MPSCFASDNKGVLTIIANQENLQLDFTQQFEFNSQYFCMCLSTIWRGKLLGDEPQMQNCILFDNFQKGTEMLFYIIPCFPTSCSNWSCFMSLQNISLMFSMTIAGKGPTQQHSPHPANSLQTDKGKTDLCLVYVCLVTNGLWHRQELVRWYSFHSDCLGEMIYFWNFARDHHCGSGGSVLCSAIRAAHQLSSEQQNNSFTQE